MNALVRKYEGRDMVIPREALEEIGVKPGDELVIRPQVKLAQRQHSADEIARRRKILKEVSGAWTAEDEEAFRRNRREMWATWQPRNWS